MLAFGSDWGAEIADISERPEYQNCTVRISVSSEAGVKDEYDLETGEWTSSEVVEVLYEGRGRFAPIRWGVDARDTHIANASTTTRLRVQVPSGALQGVVPRGALVTILSAPFAPHMELETARVVGDIQNSSNGSRTLETEWNSDVRKLG